MKYNTKTKSKGSSGFAPDTGGKAMAGFSGAAPAVAGQVSTGGRKGNTNFAPDTGGKAMAGFTGATPKKPC
jgi:hypothetical protein